MIGVFAAWCGHTERSRQDAAAVDTALTALGWKRAYAASLMGLTEKQLIHQLAGVQPLNHWRLASLPEAFHQAYDAAKATQRGAVVLEPEMLALIRGAVAIGRRRMVKVLPQLVQKKVS